MNRWSMGWARRRWFTTARSARFGIELHSTIGSRSAPSRRSTFHANTSDDYDMFLERQDRGRARLGRPPQNRIDRILETSLGPSRIPGLRTGFYFLGADFFFFRRSIG